MGNENRFIDVWGPRAGIITISIHDCYLQAFLLLAILTAISILATTAATTTITTTVFYRINYLGQFPAHNCHFLQIEYGMGVIKASIMLRNAVIAGCVASASAFVATPVMVGKSQVRLPHKPVA